MFKIRFKAQLFNMAMWYGIFSLFIDAFKLQPMPFIIVLIAALMAWTER